MGGISSNTSCNTTIQDGVSNPPLSNYAWFCGNQTVTSEVAQLLPNGFGLYDMHGNVWEWTSDWYGCTYPNSGTWCESGSEHVNRGGSWSHDPLNLSSSVRNQNPSTGRYLDIVFRLRKLVVEDLDEDGVNSLQDCDDSDSTVPNNDADCDGTLTVDDCDDNDADSTIVSEDSDCDGVPDGCFLADCDMSVDLGNGIGADFVLIEGEDLVDPGIGEIVDIH